MLIGEATKDSIDVYQASVEDECLSLTDTAINYVKEQGAYTEAVYGTDNFVANTLLLIDKSKFNGGSKAADTFNSNKLPVADDIGSAVTDITAQLASAPTFTSDKFKATFNGETTEDLIPPVVKYQYTKINGTTLDNVSVTLNTADIIIPEMDVTVE